MDYFKLIPLRSNKYPNLFAKVDPEDFEALSVFSWHPLLTYGGTFYAVRCGRNGNVYMHRQILAAPDGIQVDHCNRDKLDNTRRNLRLATKSQNMANRLMPNKTGYRGISRQGERYRAGATLGGRFYQTCLYSTAEEAAHAYDTLALQLHGEFAVLNFPNESPVSASA